MWFLIITSRCTVRPMLCRLQCSPGTKTDTCYPPMIKYLFCLVRHFDLFVNYIYIVFVFVPSCVRIGKIASYLSHRRTGPSDPSDPGRGFWEVHLCGCEWGWRRLNPVWCQGVGWVQAEFNFYVILGLFFSLLFRLDFLRPRSCMRYLCVFKVCVCLDFNSPSIDSWCWWWPSQWRHSSG